MLMYTRIYVHFDSIALLLQLVAHEYHVKGMWSDCLPNPA